MLDIIRNWMKPAGPDYKKLLTTGAVIADVRTRAEFASGHIEGSVNYPIDLIRNKTAELKKTGKPVITVCRSGARSAMARNILRDAGIEAYNGGSWTGLKAKL